MVVGSNPTGPTIAPQSSVTLANESTIQALCYSFVMEVMHARTFALAALCALNLSQATATKFEGLDFKTNYKPGSVATYGVSMSSHELMDMSVLYTVRETVKSPNSAGLTCISLKTTAAKDLSKQSAGNVSISPAEDEDTTVTPDGAFKDLAVRVGTSDQDYLFLCIAGITANKHVAVGDTYPVKWSDLNKTMSVAGTGKIQSIDAGGSVTVAIDTKMTMQGQSLGNLQFISVFSGPDYTLKSSKGKFSLGSGAPGGPAIKVSVTRQD